MEKPFLLFGTKGSGSAAIEAALHVAGLPFVLKEAASWLPESDVAGLARVNPLRQVPTLVLPDGSVMSESAAILIHLGLVSPDALLLPETLAERAQAIRGLVFIAANCYSAIGILDYPQRFTDDASEQAAEAIRAATRRRLHEYWELFADTFGEFFREGEPPRALQLLAAVVSRWSGSRAHLAQHRPEFLAALKRIDQHPWVAPVFRRHWED